MGPAQVCGLTNTQIWAKVQPRCLWGSSLMCEHMKRCRRKTVCSIFTYDLLNMIKKVQRRRRLRKGKKGLLVLFVER